VPTPKENYDLWLSAKDRLNTEMIRVVSANKSGDAETAIANFNGSFEFLLKQTRAIFDQDEKRIQVRNETIASLQDQIANLKGLLESARG